MGDSLETLSRNDEAIDCFARARRRWASPAVEAVAEEALCASSRPSTTPRAATACCAGRSPCRSNGAVRLQAGAALARQGASARCRPTAQAWRRASSITKARLLSRLGRFREAVEVGEKGVALLGRTATRPAGLRPDPARVAFAASAISSGAIECHAEAVALYEQAGDLRGPGDEPRQPGGRLLLLGDLRAALEHDELSLRSARAHRQHQRDGEAARQPGRAASCRWATRTPRSST